MSLTNLNILSRLNHRFKSDTGSVNGYFKIYQNKNGFIVLLNGAHYLKLGKSKADDLNGFLDFTKFNNFDKDTFAIAYP